MPIPPFLYNLAHAAIDFSLLGKNESPGPTAMYRRQNLHCIRLQVVETTLIFFIPDDDLGEMYRAPAPLIVRPGTIELQLYIWISFSHTACCLSSDTGRHCMELPVTTITRLWLYDIAPGYADNPRHTIHTLRRTLPPTH